VVITLQDVCFFFAGIVAAVVALRTTLKLRLKAEFAEGYEVGTRVHLTGREAPLTKAIEYMSQGTDPEAVVACAAVFESFLVGTHVKSASPFVEVGL
jgi:putative effector of murein hydrolase